MQHNKNDFPKGDKKKLAKATGPEEGRVSLRPLHGLEILGTNLFLYDLKPDFLLNDPDDFVADKCHLGAGKVPTRVKLF